MAFPNDLDDVVVFKIHPAIGIARISNNDDYYIFGEHTGDYKSNKLIKRQAVRFRVFAYGENHVGLGELTSGLMDDLGISSVWSAKVANRKVARLEGVPLSGTEYVISAEASSDANDGKLVGSLPQFVEGAEIPLGQINGDGVFIPPKGDVYRRTPTDLIENYPARSRDVADTSSDGSVSVHLEKDGQTLDVLPACIVVAPQDFSPDTDEGYTLHERLKDELGMPHKPQNPGNIHNQTARQLDIASIKPATEDFNPGFEVDLGSRRSEVMDIKSIFYDHNQNPHVDPREMRIHYKSNENDTGAVHGQLTSGLCSTWQGDFTACVGYWVEHLPPDAFLDDDGITTVKVFRRKYSDTSSNADVLTSGEDFNDDVDKMGIVRLVNGRKIETERDPGDDV